MAVSGSGSLHFLWACGDEYLGLVLQEDKKLMHFLADVDRALPRLQRAARVAEVTTEAALVRRMVKNLKDPVRMATVKDGKKSSAYVDFVVQIISRM
jgi:hypothetical protein